LKTDSNDERNKPDDEFGMYAPGSSTEDVRLGDFEAFLLGHGHGRAGGQGAVSVTLSGFDGIASKV
jgi:hypothetical protein